MEVFEAIHCEENLSVIKRLYENNGINQPKGPLLKATPKEIPKKIVEKLTDFDPEVVKKLVDMKIIYRSPGDESFRLNKIGATIMTLCQNSQEVVNSFYQKTF